MGTHPGFAGPPAVRCAVLPPAPVPYREPLFARLAARGRLELKVVYQSASQPSWDQVEDWFPSHSPYDSIRLRSWQRPRSHAGRTPVLVPRGLTRELDAFQPECVVSWEFGPTSLMALRWCRRRERPLLIFSELPPKADEVLSELQLRIHRLVVPRAAGFVVSSSAAKRRLVSMGVPSENVEVSLQSADVERFRSAAGLRPTRNGRQVRILCVSRLVPDKNVATLLEAFAYSGLAFDEAELEVCGSGPLELELERLASDLCVPARFRGYVEPRALPATYARADALALVSTYETFGVALREAAAAGLPLICSRAAGAAGDVAVDGRNAILVDPGSVADVAEALRRIVRDPQLRERMASESLRISDERDPVADAEAFERAVLRAVRRLR